MQNTHKDLQDSGLHNTSFFTTKYISCDKMHCYKYELQFNSVEPIIEDTLKLIQRQLNAAFKTTIEE